MPEHKIKGWLLNLGLVDYDKGLEIQADLEAKRKAGDIPDTLILLEHYPVYTMGASTDPANLLLDLEDLKEKGIKVREIRRGGDVTFHGPGQLVGYPIIDLSNHKKDVHYYLRCLESLLIVALKDFGLEAYTIQGMTGVWCNGQKIAAIGVGISRWITTHGFALNVDTDLSYFTGIIPCGIRGKEVTSIQAQLMKAVSMEEVRQTVADSFAKQFAMTLEPVHLKFGK